MSGIGMEGYEIRTQNLDLRTDPSDTAAFRTVYEGS
jgi:hypothetical protein